MYIQKTVNNLQKIKQWNALSGGISVGPKKNTFSAWINVKTY